MSSKSELESSSTASPSEKEMLDILILGATGFTGIHCIPYVYKLSKDKNRNLTWGVAGRSEQKLKDALEKVGKELDADLSATPIVLADINSYESLLEMAKKTRLVINCCGPFRFLGDIVVKACIEAGTHHVDVSGEPEYMERIQLEQHDAAQKKGVYVISACGFDSIPTDMGVIFLQQKFDGTLNTVESYLSCSMKGGSKGGSAVNYGTWASAVESLGNEDKLRDIRRRAKANTKKLPNYTPRLALKTLPHKSDKVKGWVLPFLGADRSVVRRSQQYLYEFEDKRPVQIGTYFTIASTLAVVLMAIYGLIFSVLTKFEFGRKLLLNYPSFFSGGFFSKEPPSEEVVSNTKFTVMLYGEGWKEKLANKDDQYTKPVDKCIFGKVSGTNPGYGATCLTLTWAAITVLTEREKLAGSGKTLPHKSDKVNGWVLPFLGADRSVVRRSQQYLYEFEDKRPVQIGTYFTIASTLAVVLMAIYGLIFSVLTKFEFGRKLLLNYPSIFSGGFFSKEPPSEEVVSNTKFTVMLYGEGWKEKLANKDDQYTKPVDKCIFGKVSGTNPAYGATCLTLTWAAIMVLTEKEKLAGNGKGGVYPPGAAFAKTSIIEKLNETGLKFEITYQKDL